MSYCVNCGVELEKTEQLCPLCFQLVQNPLELQNPQNMPPRRNYPDQPVGGMKVDFRDLILPITLILIIPVLITLICDYLLSGGLGWSIYVALSIGLALVYMIPPLAVRRKWIPLCVLADILATMAFLYILDLLTEGAWFSIYALPITTVSGVLLLGVTCLFLYTDMRKLARFAVVLFALAINSLTIDYVFKKQSEGLVLGWSLYVAVTCIIVAGIALIVNHNQRLKEQVRQRFFV